MASVKKRPETTQKEKSGDGQKIEKRPAIGNQENGRWVEIFKSYLVGGVAQLVGKESEPRGRWVRQSI